MPIATFGYVQGANAEISDLTGAEFGDGYERLIADGSFVMDSAAAARGMAALRTVAPDRVVELATALQHAFCVDGRSLSDAATYRELAEAAGLNADAVVAAFEAPAARESAELDFRRATQLGVVAFPTLLAVDGAVVTVLARGRAGVDEIDRRLTALSSTRTS